MPRHAMIVGWRAWRSTEQVSGRGGIPFSSRSDYLFLGDFRESSQYNNVRTPIPDRMGEDWQPQGMGNGFYDPDRPETGSDASAAPIPPIPVFYAPSTYRGFPNAATGTFALLHYSLKPSIRVAFA